MFAQAEAELRAVRREERSRPEVRSVRVDLHLAAREWRRVVAVARPLARAHPACENAWIGWAFALRELQRVRQARDVLLEAEREHGLGTAILHYNLACYESLLGDLAAARQRLATACRMERRFKVEAEDDPDLAALRSQAEGRRGRRG
jgi:hypothetical protein